MKFYLYIIINKLNNKCYVGVTNNLNKRWYTHQHIAKVGKNKMPKHFQILHSAIKKYTAENFIFEPIIVFENENLCYKAEIELISKLKLLNIKLYNIAIGGKGTGSGIDHPTYGKKLSEEWVNNMSKGIKLSYKNNPDRKIKLKKQMIDRNWVGSKHPMYGKKHTDNAKVKISKSSKNKILSEETKTKISLSNKGRKVSVETRNKLSLKQKEKNLTGDRNPNFGNKWSDDQKKNLSQKKMGTKNLAQRKFSNEQILEILRLKYEDHITLINLTKQFNCSLSTLKYIVYGKSYKEIYEKYFKLRK